MKEKVALVTNTFFETSGGSGTIAAQVLSNFMSQRVIQPLVPVAKHEQESALGRFALNCQETVAKIKEFTRKSGTPADMMRRNVMAAGAQGPLSSAKLSLRDLSRIFGYGNNPSRLKAINDCKYNAETVPELVQNVTESAKHKPRRDKIAGTQVLLVCALQYSNNIL